MKTQNSSGLGLFEDSLVSLKRDAEVLESIFEAVAKDLQNGHLGGAAEMLHFTARKVSELTAEFLAARQSVRHQRRSSL